MTYEFIIRIFVAAVLGGLIGLEREYRAKEAGFRTHFLVALGSSLFMILSQYGFDTPLTILQKTSFDPSRIASQVVTGIGFIGAGIIIFQKNVIRGLTTAAGLWVTSAIGLTCGAGLYILASATTILVLLCLEVLNVILQRFGTRNISVTITSKSKDNIKGIFKLMKKESIEVYSYNMKERNVSGIHTFAVTMELKMRRYKYETILFDIISKFEGTELESME
ncbi:MgtC/SapB family protein [Xylanibacter rodentium]|jgi:putative Mg2+ transporter-C (MgtC) family protein|uniref:Methyltransferase n=3 Tax=Xylanibacter rodentium TaxID=2736289 RepID=A0ABX2AZF7_9BACT|nr:MgtC/SapB family protein [Xylanibacter rodentium]NPE12312.1 methyltransferase [Prevotella sp. PJ1A]NPE15338.1 methyltransferase [Xylanibacter rodentium]NPE37810.1 methyltransferase [Prevotella sp. PCJ2]